MRRLCTQSIPNLQFSAKIRTNKDDWQCSADIQLENSLIAWSLDFLDGPLSCHKFLVPIIYMQFIRPNIFDPYLSSICQSCIALCCLYFALFKMRIFAKYVDILRLLIPFVLKPTTCNSDQTVAGTLKFGVKIDLAHFKAILGHSLKLSKINIEDLVQRNLTKNIHKICVIGCQIRVTCYCSAH